MVLICCDFLSVKKHSFEGCDENCDKNEQGIKVLFDEKRRRGVECIHEDTCEKKNATFLTNKKSCLLKR